MADVVTQYEKDFYEAIEGLFLGVKIDGKSGYINLMKIKSDYYRNQVFPHLVQDIELALQPFPNFRSEMFEKLYTFFYRYFSETGSIYFCHDTSNQSDYEKVYAEGKDVALVWKTSMLYYVKSEQLLKNMDAEIGGITYSFDVSNLQHKQSNEKKTPVFAFSKATDKEVILSVEYASGNRKTDIDEIVRQCKSAGIKVSEDSLENAFLCFNRQNEADFFINKDAKSFLKEQLDLWLFQYMFSEPETWTTIRLAQIQALKMIATKLIEFIAQFEDELVKIWNKPKFVKNAHYVITVDQIDLRKPDLISKIINHSGFPQQAQEWVDLGIIKSLNDAQVGHVLLDNIKDVSSVNKAHNKISYWAMPRINAFGKSQFPIDTKFFPDLELEIIGIFENLDDALDGRLIHSENFQALNTISQKFSEKVKTLYIDPPFNLDSSDQFMYRTNYKDSNWATLLENRLSVAQDLLDRAGMMFVRCDYNGNWLVRCQMDSIFGADNFRNELFINRIKKNVTNKGKRNIPAQIDSLFVYGKTKDSEYTSVLKPLDEKKSAYWHSMDSAGVSGPRQCVIEGKTYFPPKGTHFKFTQRQTDEMFSQGRIRVNVKTGKPQYLVLEKDAENLDTNWTDISGYSFSTGFQTENSEKLLNRVLNISSNEGSLVLDFFLGSGTTTAVAHKLGRKWVGIEMGSHFNTVVLPRMKKVLSGEQSGISKDVDWDGGGFFKYYDLEQYEETLSLAHYSACVPGFGMNIYENPVFLPDKKLSDCVDVCRDTVGVIPNTPYEDIDWAETLSNLTGKSIKAILLGAVVFSDGEQIKFDDLPVNLIRPLLYW